MKRIIIISVLLATASSYIAINQHQSSNQLAASEKQPATKAVVTKPQKAMDHIVLTPSQKNEYQAAMQAFGQQRKKLLQQRKTISREEYRGRLMALKANHKANLLALMGEKEYRQYQDKWHSMRQARHKHAPHEQKQRPLSRRLTRHEGE